MTKADKIACFAERLKQAEDPFEEWSATLANLGITGYFFGYSQALRNQDGMNFIKDMYFKHTYCKEWDKFAGADAIAAIDPSVDRMLGGKQVVDWTIHDHHYGEMTTEQRILIDFENDLGMKHGASVVLELTKGCFSGMGLWFGEAQSAAQYLSQWAQYGQDATRMAQVFDSWIRKENPNLMVGLTPREIDCLAWLAHGMRPAEICHKLGISEKTFEKHISNAKQKLNAKTRDQALARAVLFDLI